MNRRFLVTAFTLAVCLSGGLAGQNQKRYIPPPLKVLIPFEAAWTAMIETLDKASMPPVSEEQGRGRIITEARDYSSGPLAESHIAKIGEKPKLVDGEWVRVKYQYEIELQFIGERETLVTVSAIINALKRPFLKPEAWVEIPSSGRLEEELLNNFGQHLFGTTFSLNTAKKGFWERSPGVVPEADVRPDIVGPERKRP